MVRAEPLDAPDEHAERRRVDKGRVGEVDHDLLAALSDHVEQLLLELGRAVEVDLAAGRDYERVGTELLGLDVEVHARIIPPEVALRPGGPPAAESIRAARCVIALLILRRAGAAELLAL